MGLITHNRIYVCIGASPCPVIVDLVIIDSVGLSHHYAAAALARWQPPCQGAATHAVALTSGNPLRAPCSRPPLRASHCKRLCPQAAVAPAGWLQPTVHAGVCCPHGRHFCPQALPLWAAVAGLPFGLALALAGCPLVGGLGRGLAVGGGPYIGAGRGWPSLLLAAFTAKT
ncbi:hypothetical protein GW17_00056667 [Ensete ventricosum]|nr:hypothetical protein GW17_00056667 [Ensete ventricosum]